jgi:Zn-dependent protease with chaperone function
MLTGWTLAIWLGGLLVLLLAGLGLSATVIRRARQVPNSADGRVAGLDALLRRLYAGVLWISCAYYYVSMPLLVVLVLAMTGGLIYSFFVLGHVPIKLALLIVVLALVTVWSIVRSLFVRVADEDPGIKLDLDGVPRLRHLLERVATRIGTRPVDNVYMTAGTDIAVFERGGMLRQLRGKSERCLILGAGVLHGFRLGPFRAVLGHEYGHFSNRDTAGGGFALAVRRSLVTMAVCIAQSGAAAWYNPAWLFLNGFHRVFLRISHGASRLQEILADRWAAFSYGAAAFERGLRHVIEASVRFDARANAALKEAIEKKLPLSNLYAHGPSSGDDEAAIDKAVEAALVAEPSPYDSHPRPADRFAWVKTLSTPDIETAADDEEEVWSLFPDRWEMERRMTEEVRTAVKQQHGIEIPATA